MALYHLSAKALSRSSGDSAVAAAYRSGEELTDERTGDRHDYSRRSGGDHAEIIAPDQAPDWVRDRAQLWNAAEAAERRRDSQVAREVIRLCLYQGFSNKQIARCLHVSRGSVAVRMNRAINLLKRRIDARTQSLPPEGSIQS